MKARRGYVPDEGIFPFMGINTLVPSTQLDPRFSPNLQNVDITKGLIEKRRGYQALGGSLVDPVIGVYEFETLAGSKILLAFTTKKQYRWSGSAWTNITYQSGGVDVDWTGTEEDWLDIQVVAGLDASGTYTKWIVVSNGKDQARYWDGSMTRFARYHTDAVSSGGAGITFPNFVTYRAGAQFYDHVVLANVTAASAQKNLIAWSHTGSLVDFGGANAGEAYIPDSMGAIVKLAHLGDRLMIYSENSVGMLTYVAGDLIFTQEQVLQNSRLVSGRCVVSIGPYHLLLTEENVLVFDGTKFARPVGDAIYRQYRRELYTPNRVRAFAFHDPARQHVYFNVPISTDQNVFYRMEYNLADMSQSVWTRLTYGDRPVSMGLFSREQTLKWNSTQLSGLSWSEIGITWNQATVRKAFPIRVFGSQSAVFIDDELTTRDGSQAIDSYWDSKDFAVPGNFRSSLGRWLEIELDAQGYEVDVYISDNEGQTFSFVQKLELGTNWGKYTVPIDVMSKHLRVRLRNACVNSKFQVRWMRIWVREGGPT